MTIEKLLEFAIKAAAISGEYLKNRQNVTIDSAEGRDIKLSSDKDSEKIIVGILEQTGIPVLSEEVGYIGGKNSDMLWIVDPLDGTVNYSRGLDGLCCVSIALWKGDEPILGVINRFDSGEIYHGVVGEGAYLNGNPVKSSMISSVESAVLNCGFPINMDYSADNLQSFIKNIQIFKKVRMLGTAALMCVMAATGTTDAYFEDNIMLWDIAGALAIAKANDCGISFERAGNNRCKIKCFANEQLKEDFYDKAVR